MKVAPFLLFLLLLIPISSYASFASIKEQCKTFAAWAELKYDQFMGLQPSFADLKEFKKIQDKYQGNIENYYFGKGIFKKHPTAPSSEEIKHTINSLPDAPEPDSKLPKWIIDYIKKELNKNGIIPEKVSIRNHDKNTLGYTSFYMSKPYFNKNEILIKISSCNIEVNSSLLAYFSKSSFKGLINHEIIHLINAHPASKEMYLFFLKESPNQHDIAKITQETNIAYEYQADLSPGILNKKNAKRLFNCQKEKFTRISLDKQSLINDIDTHPAEIKRYQKAKQLCNFHTIKDQMKTSGMSINELINQFKAQRQEIRIS